MARTTPAAVRSILEPGGDYDTLNEPSLVPFITAAGIVTDRVRTCALSKGYTMTAVELETLERWLAAHFYQQSDQGYSEKKSDRASAVFQGRTGMKLESTKYGQTAMVLAPLNCLEMINKAKYAEGYWLGRNPPDQTDYEDR